MLSDRQEKLLVSIIEEFIKTAQAVGSLNISEKYGLEVSPATIRNEMAKLSELGLLEKTHASSGRVPTARALKWFLEEIKDDLESINVYKATDVREKLFQIRFNTDKLLSKAVNLLAELTGNTAVAVLAGRRFTAGVSQFLNEPEYQNLQRLQKIITVLEDYNSLTELFSLYEGEDIEILIGEETGIDELSESAVAFSIIQLHGQSRGYIGVVGPNRMDYRKVIPAIKYIVATIEESVSGW